MLFFCSYSNIGEFGCTALFLVLFLGSFLSLLRLYFLPLLRPFLHNECVIFTSFIVRVSPSHAFFLFPLFLPPSSTLPFSLNVLFLYMIVFFPWPFLRFHLRLCFSCVSSHLTSVSPFSHHSMCAICCVFSFTKYLSFPPYCLSLSHSV